MKASAVETLAVRSAWPALSVVMMVVGYAGYYLCRSHFSVAKPLLLDAFRDQGVTKATLRMVAAWGTAFYAAGKFLFGSLADVLGGREETYLSLSPARGS